MFVLILVLPVPKTSVTGRVHPASRGAGTPAFARPDWRGKACLRTPNPTPRLRPRGFGGPDPESRVPIPISHAAFETLRQVPPLMFHATTVLSVRHNGQSVMASDGQVTFGDTVVKQSRTENPATVQRSDPRGLCRIGGGLVGAVLALRGEARTIPRQPRALGRRAREGLADRSRAAASGGDAHRAWTAARPSSSPAPAI